jgi:hypothetical protein
MSDKLEELNSLLNTDLGNVETKIPLLKGLAELEVVAVEIKDNKAGDGSGINCTFALTTPMTAVDGRLVSAGFKVFHNVSLKQTEKYSPEKIKENVARLKEGISGTKVGSFSPAEQYIGMKFMAQLAPKMDDQFGDKTVISRFVKKA